MSLPSPVPIIVGVGDIRNKSLRTEDALEPAQLMVDAIQQAIADCGLSPDSQRDLRSRVDSLRVVPTWTWAYSDLPGIISKRLGAQPSQQVVGEHGGNQPAVQCDEAARDIAARRSVVTVLTGGEALASRPDTLHSMGLPIHIYPLYENGRRAHLRQSASENDIESSTMYAAFDQISSENEYSWNYKQPPKTAEQIAKPSPKNRMICDPYRLLMNAFNGVNLAAACILTSAENALALGIPKEKWIYVLGGAGTSEHKNFWKRRHFHHSEAIGKSIDAALDVSGLSSMDIDCYDFYSCFPIVPKLACDHVGLSTTSWQKPVTLLGGLTSFGGAGNNYSMHAITAMTRSLRSKKHDNGLILANGGNLTHQHAICLSANPRGDQRDYPKRNPLPLLADEYSPQFVDSAQGPAAVETYTVEYSRDGTAATGLIVGRLLGSAKRFIANHGDRHSLLRLANKSTESIGKFGYVTAGEDRRNLFYFDRTSKL
ncbi:hypothetical protein E4U53_007644 [Claviceps sorghi]|nr:hypothetical protein E4U53_007644 [Claviceps sorghi]